MLDKATANQRKKVKGEVLFTLKTNPRKSKEISKHLDGLKTEYDQKFMLIEKKLKGHKPNKTRLASEAMVAYSDFNREQHDLLLGFCIDYLQTRLSDVEAIVQGITEKLDLDLPSVKTEMESLKKTLSSPEVVTISEFVKQMLTRIAEYKKRMRENDLAT